MRERIATLAITGAMAVLVSGCGASSTTGTDTPEASADPDATTSALPARPREIDLTGVDTCTLLTAEQQRRLGTDMPPDASVEADRYGNTYCHYDKILSSPRFGYTIKAVTQEDATIYLTGKRDATARVVSVADFPTVEAHRPADERGCFALVSTADGQYLSVQYGESTGSNDTTEVACEKARMAADMAMRTLLTQR